MALQPRTAALFHREKGIAGRRVEGSRARARLVSRGLQALTSLRGTGREDWLVSACIPHVMNTGRNANWIPIPDHITISIADWPDSACIPHGCAPRIVACGAHHVESF